MRGAVVTRLLAVALVALLAWPLVALWSLRDVEVGCLP